MKPLATIAALIALAPCAYAQEAARLVRPAPYLMKPSGPVKILPPVEFSNYKGKYTIERVETPEQVQTRCALTKPALACAVRSNTAPCRIVMVGDDYIRATGYTPDIVLTHEKGHCAGWPASHPNSQVLP